MNVPLRPAALALALLAPAARGQVAASPAQPGAEAPRGTPVPGLTMLPSPGYAPKDLGRWSRLGIGVLEGPILYSIVQNRVAYHLGDPEVYDVSWENFTNHLDGPWWYDQDQFATNQFGHPYEGSMYYTAPRSLGLSFYESFLVAELGSFLWETGGETEPPSVNDQITTPIAGSILGEVLFRLSGRVVDAMRPGFWRELAATAVSPFTGLNRQLFGEYRPRGFNDQPWFAELRLSIAAGGRATTTGVDVHDPTGSVSIAARAQNGNPGSDWEFREPFDYYDAAASLVIDQDATSKKAFGNLTMRGLVLADGYGAGRSRSLWGLMAAYDYLTPGSFRASSSNVSIGTVGQIPLAADLALQGTAYAGIGFGAGGSAAEPAGKRDYHFGAQAVSLVEGRLLWADRGLLRLAGRSYYTSGKVSPETDSFELVHYGEVEALWRFYGPHAISLSGMAATRRAQYADVPDVRSRSSQLLVSWVLVNDRFLGAGR